MIPSGSGGDTIGGGLYINNGRHSGGGGDINALSQVTAHLRIIDRAAARAHFILNA